MSLVGELFAKEFGEKEGVCWQRVMQVLASYNWKNGKFDVRLYLSGLKGMELKILSEYLKFLPKLRVVYNKHNYKIYDLVTNSLDAYKRMEKEKERKKKILPFIIKRAKEFSKELVRNIGLLEPMIFLRGSASPRSKKIFWYYDSPELIFVSDVDLEIIVPEVNTEIIHYSRNEAYNFSVKSKIPINVYFKRFSNLDEGLVKYGYPLSLPYKFYG